jgi:hypothetical protein
MRRFAFAMSVLFAAAVVFAAPSSAARIGGQVFGAFNTHGMNDVNEAVDGLNALNGTNFDQIENGLTGGLAVMVWPTGNFMLSAAWEPLWLNTKDSASGSELKADANSFQATAGYFFPTLAPAKFGLAGGVGMYQLGGEFSDGITPASSIEGSGVGFHLMGLTEMTVSPGFAVTGGAGWRWADIEIDDDTATIDYSGFMARLGLAFYLPTP